MRWINALALIRLGACSVATEPSLIDPSQIVGDRIPFALTNTRPSAQRGEAIFKDRESGHCVLCHVVNDLDVEFQGNVGPDLSEVADRLDDGQLRLRIVDYQIVRSGAVMPSYYRIHDLYQVGDAYEGDPVLSAQDVEDLVAYLGALRAIGDDD